MDKNRIPFRQVKLSLLPGLFAVFMSFCQFDTNEKPVNEPRNNFVTYF